MAACAKCGVPLEPDAAVCANCGRIVAPREAMPLWVAYLIGLLLMCVLWLLLVYALIATLEGPCGERMSAKMIYIGIIIGCLAALVGGIAAARRGYPARAVIFLAPAIGVLVGVILPGAACTNSIFAAHC